MVKGGRGRSTFGRRGHFPVQSVPWKFFSLGKNEFRKKDTNLLKAPAEHVFKALFDGMLSFPAPATIDVKIT